MSDVTIPGGKIRAFVERIENLDTEIQELNEQKKEVFAEAKGDGFDVKILKEIVKLRKQDEEERDERESMLDLYMRAMEQAVPEEKVAKAALRKQGGLASANSPYELPPCRGLLLVEPVADEGRAWSACGLN